jgi:hypothetical protein
MFRTPDSSARGVPLMFDLGFLAVLVLLFLGRNILLALVTVSDHAFTCISGYLRRRPDPWLEIALRNAFAEFDRDLAAALRHDHAPR